MLFQPWGLKVAAALLLCCALPLSLEAQETEPADAAGGQASLDEATLLKVGADNMEDLNRVIELCEQARVRGLGKEEIKWAELLLTGSRLERATHISSMVLSRQPPDPRWLQLRSLAMADLDQVLELNAQVAQAHLLVGRLQLLPRGNRDKAKASFDEVIRLAHEDPRLQSKGYAYRAEIQTVPQLSLADLSKAIQLDPTNLQALRNRAMQNLEAGNHEAAMPDLEAALEMKDDDAKTHEALSIAYFIANRIDDAMVSINRALELNPKAPSAYSQRARMNLSAKKFDAALSDVDKAIALAPNSLSLHLIRAQILQSSGNHADAKAIVNRILAQSPGLEIALRMRARILADEGKYTEAIADVTQAMQNKPEDPDLLILSGTLHMANKDAEKAIAVFSKLLAQGLDSAPIYRSRADAYLHLNRHAEALSDYESALKLSPGDSGVLNNLAWMLATSVDKEIRNGERAVKLATKACRLTEYQKAHILSTLAAAHAEQGDFAEATRWARKAVEVGDERVGQQLQKELESYLKKKPWREDKTDLATDTEDKKEPAVEEKPEAEESDEPVEQPSLEVE